jgi:hypothetical protein
MQVKDIPVDHKKAIPRNRLVDNTRLHLPIRKRCRAGYLVVMVSGQKDYSSSTRLKFSQGIKEIEYHFVRSARRSMEQLKCVPYQVENLRPALLEETIEHLRLRELPAEMYIA